MLFKHKSFNTAEDALENTKKVIVQKLYLTTKDYF